MSVEVKTFCPLGAKCEEAKDGSIYRCAWYAEVHGKKPDSTEVIREWRCAMNWMPMLTIENSLMQRQTGAAVEDFRNEMVKANQMSQQVLLATVKESHPEIRTIEVMQ